MGTGAVLVVGRAIHPPWNEGTRVIARAIAQAAAATRPVGVVSLTAPEFAGEQEPGLHVRHAVARGGYGAAGDYRSLAGLARQVRRAARELRPEVAHLVGAPLALAPLLRAQGIPVVVHVPLTAHAYASRVERARAALARLYDPFVAAYAPAADGLRDDLEARGHDPARLVVVPPPVDVARFRPHDRAAARAALGLDGDGLLVVYVGTVSPRRFPAAEVAAGLAAASGPLELAVFAPVRTHEYNVGWARDNVAAGAHGTGLRVRIALEDLTEERKALVYSAADAVVLPFGAPVAVEPPLTLLEAMACEAVVMVAPAANRSGLVADGDTGLAFSGSAGLALAVERLRALGPDGRAAMGARARALVERRFGERAVTEALGRLWAVAGAGNGRAGGQPPAYEHRSTVG
jgi:glycosyltransferase involved in cell wall biosynthesis